MQPTRWIIATTFAALLALLPVQGQDPSASTSKSTVPAKKKVVRRPARKAAVVAVPMETAPATAPTAASAAQQAQQRAADRQVLQQQQADSDKARLINDQQVKDAVQRQDRIQNEQRIQDAPGPGQVPAVPGPVVPATTMPDQRINDTPSAVPASVTPSQLPVPQSLPH